MGLFEDLFAVFQANIGTIFIVLLLLLAALVTVYLVYSKMETEDPSYEERRALIKEALTTASADSASPLSLRGAPTPLAIQRAQQALPPVPSLDEPLNITGERLKILRQAAHSKTLPDDMRQSLDEVYEAGKIAMNEGRWEQAKTYLIEALKIHPEDPEIYIKLTVACYEMGDLQSSEKFYKDAIARHPLAAKVFYKHLAFRV